MEQATPVWKHQHGSSTWTLTSSRLVKSIFLAVMMLLAVLTLSLANASSSPRSIPFVSLIHEENARSSHEQTTRSFQLNHENNLMNNLNQLQTLMNRREMISSIVSPPSSMKRDENMDSETMIVKQLDEPRSQFIIKLKHQATHSQQQHEFVQSVIQSGKPLGYGDVFSVVMKTSEIITHTSALNNMLDDKPIEWIAEYEPRFKSDLNFPKIQQLALEQMNLENHVKNSESTTTSTTRVSDNNNINNTDEDVDHDNLFVPVIITILPSLDAVRVNKELEEAKLIASELNLKFSQLFPSNNNNKKMLSQIHVTDQNKLEMSFSPLIAQQVGEILKNHPHVHFIERRHVYQLFNKKSSVIMQGYGPSPSVGMSAVPFYEMGILGNGQIVGVSDTGIDWDNCLFRDALNPTVRTNTLNFDHRKIVKYDTVSVYSGWTTYTSDGHDGVDGHGTHVAGSVCGSIQNMTYDSSVNPINEYHGIAPNARLYFTDLQKTGNPQLLIPSSYQTDIFKPAYDTGARIFSNSWGASAEAYFSCSYDCKDCIWRVSVSGYRAGQRVSDDTCRALFGSDTCCSVFNKYNAQCQDVDQALWKNQDSIILFAQGNSGAISSKGNVGSPAVAKNSVSVGASMTSNAAFQDSVYYEDYKNKIQNAGLPFSTTAECCSYVGEKQDIVRGYCCPSEVKSKYTNNPSIYNENNLAYFSSRGPAVGDRIKPDVTGIGYNVVSGHSDGSTSTNQCSTIGPVQANSAALMTNQGTSMATPLTAGAVALLREFFQNKKSIITPSGPLLKAALVHSSIPMSGSVAYSTDETQRRKLSQLGTPNSYEGFGRVFLGSLLNNQDGTPLSMSINEKSFSNTGESLRLCFKRKSTQTVKTSPFFKATLAWYDYPGSVAVTPQLISDLNLFVNTYVSSSSSSGNDNSKPSQLTVIAGNYGNKLDTTNNVERIVVEQLPEVSNSDSNSSVYVSVAVYITSIMTGVSQPYALLLTYPTEMFEQVSTDSCVYSTDLPVIISDGAIAGIVIGSLLAVVLVVAVIAVIVYLVLRSRKGKVPSQPGMHENLISDYAYYSKRN
ncbi:hypothetical protein C9374_012420 [Naegleria lovaniensis]|uniref:Peptidase S8/S53 domain-containing protein n=1 Tax=Naegleria lovaniensis TaxID=51637 RepID=A0AA88KNJ5_NAELO|nr:uncharacterized protein C9374_012420 [Naegleria lovaniensis]KAG2392168.1 hypothetical protein C9374_012420 [Naegleria lovaniensis]